MCGGLLEVPQIIISVGYEAMRFAKFTVASFNFFLGWGVGVLLEVPQIIITKAYDVCKIYGCIFNFFLGGVGGLGGWGGHGKHPKLILLWPMHVSMHYTHVLNHFDFTIYFAFW